MPSCEKCWHYAYLNSCGSIFVQKDIYYMLVKDHDCTPKEQAGQYWDEKKQRDRRDFLNVKPRQKQYKSLGCNTQWRGRRGKV